MQKVENYNKMGSVQPGLLIQFFVSIFSCHHICSPANPLLHTTYPDHLVGDPVHAGQDGHHLVLRDSLHFHGRALPHRHQEPWHRHHVPLCKVTESYIRKGEFLFVCSELVNTDQYNKIALAQLVKLCTFVAKARKSANMLE